MTSSDNFKETLKQQADIVRIVGDYVKLKKAGSTEFLRACVRFTGEDAIVLSACHATVLSLFRLRSIW